MSARKLRILFLVNGFGIGGAERNLLALVRRLDRQKYHIVVASVGQAGPLQKEFQALGDRVVVFKKKFSFDFSLIWKVAQLIKQERIDLLQTILFYADVIGAFAARIAGVPVHLSWEVNTHPRGSHASKLRHRLTYRLAARTIDTIVPVSASVRDFLIENRRIPVEKIHLIHYGVDTDKHVPATNHRLRVQLGFGDQDRILGVVARLTHQKGHRYLIAAARDIVEEFPAARFVFVGDGPLRGALENQVRESGLEQHVRFLGLRDDVKALLGIFDLFVLPSLYEGLPNVILEAMASGKPIVATAVDGTKEAIVPGVSGLLVPAQDSPALAAAIIELLERPQLAAQMGVAARKRAVEHFSLEREVKDFECLYDSFVAKRTSSPEQSLTTAC